MPPLRRDEKFQIRLTTAERRMLESIAEREGLSASDKIRQLIRRDYLTAFAEALRPERVKRKPLTRSATRRTAPAEHDVRRFRRRRRRR